MRGMDESQKFGNSAKGVLFGMVRAFQSKVENVTSGPIGTSSWKPRLGHHMEFAQPAGWSFKNERMNPMKVHSVYLTEWNFHRNYLVNLVKWFSSLQVLHLLEALFSWYLFFPISCHFSDRLKVPRTACAVVFQKSKFRRGASKQVLLKLQKPIHLSKNRRLGIPLKLWWFFVRVPRVPKMPKKHSGLGIIRKICPDPWGRKSTFPDPWMVDFWLGQLVIR